MSIKIYSSLNNGIEIESLWKSACFINTINVLKGFCQNNNTIIYTSYNKNINIQKFLNYFDLNKYENLKLFCAESDKEMLEYLNKNMIKISYFRQFLHPLYLIKNNYNGKIFIESHGEIPNDIYKTLKKYENKFTYVTISDILKKKNNFINTIICPCAIDYDFFSKKPNNNLIKFNYEFNILYCGHVYPYKGIPLLIKLGNCLKKKNILNIGIHIVGGNKDDINLYKNYSDNVIFYGYKKQDELPNYMYASDLLILPYTNNHFQANTTTPIKLFEYLATGIPILSSSIHGIESCVKDSILYYEPDNLDDLLNKILKIKNNYHIYNNEENIQKRKEVSLNNSCKYKSKLMIDLSMIYM